MTEQLSMTDRKSGVWILAFNKLAVLNMVVTPALRDPTPSFGLYTQPHTQIGK